MQKRLDGEFYKKGLGQNFIYDYNLLNAIANDGEVGYADTVLEIGAGAGTLTKVLCSKAKKVISFEIDETLKSTLNKLAEQNKNLTLIFADFLKADLTKILDTPTRVVANIPYYITTPIIFKLVEHIKNIKSILVLVQKEVAMRFNAAPKTKDYGITSVILQALFETSIPRIVKKECFTPAPKVDSALIKLIPHNKYNIQNLDAFSAFVHQAFSMRRKTLVNNLKTKYDKTKIEQTLINYGYSASARPEEITVADFVNIFAELD